MFETLWLTFNDKDIDKINEYNKFMNNHETIIRVARGIIRVGFGYLF